MAVSHPAPWHDGYGIQVVVDAVEVSVHLMVSDQSDRVYGCVTCACLGIEPIRPRRVPDPGRSISDALHVDRTW